MWIRPAIEQDLQALTDIYNYEVEHGTATLDLTAKTLEERRAWMEAHNQNHHPLLVAEDNGCVLGYASLSDYREKEAYKSTAELSVYVAKTARGKGVATALLAAILDYAKKDGVLHNIVSVITAGNGASVHLHEKFGFRYCGTIPEVGQKFGKMLSIENYCYVLE